MYMVNIVALVKWVSFQINMDTKICSLNVKGLGARKKVFQLLKDKDIDMLIARDAFDRSFK